MVRGGCLDLQHLKVPKVNQESLKLGHLDLLDPEDKRVRRVFLDHQGRLVHLDSKDCKAFLEKREIKEFLVWMVSQDSQVKRGSQVQ